jgi:hypothetical protein
MLLSRWDVAGMYNLNLSDVSFTILAKNVVAVLTRKHDTFVGARESIYAILVTEF